MDLKNMTMDDLKEKFAAFDKKTLIKFGIDVLTKGIGYLNARLSTPLLTILRVVKLSLSTL